MLLNEINSVDNRITTDATPAALGLFELPNNSAAFIKGRILAVRSDGASKAWSFESLAKRNGGAVTLQETIPVPINAFASAADETALTGVAVAPYSDSTYMGASCTGQAGQNINWYVNFTGTTLTP